jgi:hypothetical protein
MRLYISWIILLSFIFTGTVGSYPARAQEFHLPAPGVMIHLSPEFNAPVLKGIKVHTDNPFRFDFILDRGDSRLGNNGLKDESSRLIKYFLASLTIPEKDLWVNLSPYEKNRIIPRTFGLTEMGRDLLAEDYLLKQITASLIYPEDSVGKIFWKRVYEEAVRKFGTTDIPVNTFNKVWIVPDKAVVYENAAAGTAYVVESRLKVMLEQDYLSLQKHTSGLADDAAAATSKQAGLLGSNVVREIVIPELVKEVNEDKNFAQLRQVYNSLILATWYKKKIKDSILSEVYADKNKVDGVKYTSTIIPTRAGIQFSNDVEGLYIEYLKAFKRGVYNYIKEVPDPVTNQMIPRKYFSGGMLLSDKAMKVALTISSDASMLPGHNASLMELSARLDGAGVSNGKPAVDAAMASPKNLQKIKESIAQKLGVDLNARIVSKLAHVELVRRQFLETQDAYKAKIRELLKAIRSQGPPRWKFLAENKSAKFLSSRWSPPAMLKEYPKIAQIHYNYPPDMSGVGIVMAEEVNWLSKNGIPVKIISGTDVPASTSKNQEFVYLKDLRFLGPENPIQQNAKNGVITPEFTALEERIYRDIGAQIKDQDVIIIQNVMTVRENLPFTAALQRIITENPQKQFIVYVHNAEDSRHAAYPLSLLNPVSELPNIRYVTVSNAYQQTLSDIFGVPESKFTILNPGVSPYNPLEITAKAVEDFKLHGLLGQNEVITMAFPTRVDWNKDFGKAFLILSALQKRVAQGVKLVIAIPGVGSFDAFRDAVSSSKLGPRAADFLERLRPELEKNIVFLDTALVKDYRMHRQYILDIMALSDFLLYPSRMETFGMFVIEAATTGTGIVATDLPSHLESVGGRALLFNMQDRIDDTVGAMLDRMATVNANQASRDEFQKGTLDRYDWNSLMGSQFAPLLLDVLGGGKPNDKAMLSAVPDIERNFVEGGIFNRVVRYVRDKVTAHIVVMGDLPKQDQEIIIAMPNKDNENAFYWKASSGEGESFKWNVEEVSPVVEGNYRGINVGFRADRSTGINLNFNNKANLILNHILNLRMRLFYNQFFDRQWPYNDIPEQEEALMKHVLQLSEKHQKELEQLIGAPLKELIIPQVTVERQSDGSHVILVTKTTFDGQHHYRLRMEVPPDFTVVNHNGSITINGSRRPVELSVRAMTDFEPLTPLPVEEIFNKEGVDRLKTNPGFANIARNFAALFYKEKLMAASWLYLVFVGRDTQIGARLMWSSLSSKAKEMIVRSVLDRIGGRSSMRPDLTGLVAVNDEISQERFFQNSVTKEFNRLRDSGGNPDVLGLYRNALNNAKREILFYDVLDSTFLFPGLEKRLFDDLDKDSLRAFLNSPNAWNEKNIITVLRNWNRILELTDAYTQGVNALREKYSDKTLKELTGLDEFRSLAKLLVKKVPGAADTNWRDSPYALGWGEYAADINISLAPDAIEDIAAMIRELKGRGIDIQELAQENGYHKLREYLAQNAAGLRKAKEAWSTAIEHFKTHLTADELRVKLENYLNGATVSSRKRQALLRIVISKDESAHVTIQDFLNGTTPAWLKRGFSFTNIALDKMIIHSDETFTLLDKDLDSRDLNRILDNLFAPYPIGLWDDDVGLFIANAIYTGDKNILEKFDDEGAYHGQNVVWSKSMRELKAGLIRQIRYARQRKDFTDLKRLENSLMRVIRTEEKVGELDLSEVWSWEPAGNGNMKAVAFRMGRGGQNSLGGQPSGNPQLWANSDAEGQPEFERVLTVKKWKDALSQENRQFIFSGKGAPDYSYQEGGKLFKFQGMDELSQAIEQGENLAIPLSNGLLPYVRYLVDRGSSENKGPVLNMLDRIAIDKVQPAKMVSEFADIITSLTSYDRAMLQTPKAASTQRSPGGIDLTAPNMNMQIQHPGGAITFHLDPAQLRQLQNLPGFVPVVTNIRPMTDLKAFLGLNVAVSR